MHYVGSLLENIEHCWACTIHKCIVGDSLVLSESGLRQIREVCGMDVRPGGLKAIDVSLFGRDGFSRATQAFRSMVEPSVRIETSRGYDLEGSHRHPVLIWNPDTLMEEFRLLPDIRIGDIAVIQRDQGVFSEDYVRVRYQMGAGAQPGRRKNVNSYPPVVDERVGELMGYLVGDGSYAKSRAYDIGLTTADISVADRFSHLVKEMFGGEVKLNSSTAERSARSYYYIDATCREWLAAADLDYLSCRKKAVPTSILSSPRSVQSAFLRALFDADGSASGSGTRVVLSTSSGNIASDVHMMLLNMGIVARRIPVPSTNSFRVELYGGETVKFRDLIGFGLAHKMASLDSIVARSESKLGKTNIDYIPGIERLIPDLKREILDRMGDTRFVNGSVPKECYRLMSSLMRGGRSGGTKHVSFSHLRQLIDSLFGALEWAPDLPTLQRMVSVMERHYFFDPIVSVDHKEAEMYDVSVPDGENFFSNGFISHNSQGSEFPVGIIVMHPSHSRMLRRNLLYTGITRCTERAVILGRMSAVQQAVEDDREQSRGTSLAERIRDLDRVLLDAPNPLGR